MEHNDAELIQRVLQGDQDAFSPLVTKYQKRVHALAWRKIGDFHIAQEITQDAFFKAYQQLGTLKNYNLFSGWLYVIAARLCSDWFRKNPPPEQSLEVTDMSEVSQVSYSQYVAEKQATEADETLREVVKKLLQKLPESERTVITLHYLGEMTIKAISEFLGVSPNTVKSRLSRARNRLKKEEDMIQQNLGSFQLPTQLTENIMREISRIVPTAPAANKPVVPWLLSAASAVLIFLLMGVGTQYLSRFQKPYNLNATSERTVELIEAVFVLDSPAKPDVRNQAGSSVTPGKNPGAGQQPDARLFAAALVDETEVSTPKPQWVQTKGPAGGLVQTLFTTTRGDIYAGTATNLYKLSDDGQSWKLVIAGSPTSLSLKDWMLGGTQQMVERDDRLYVATDGEVLTSTDDGETWTSLTGNAQWSLYRSTDQGDTWYSIDPRKRQDDEEERQRQGQFGISFPFPGAETTDIYMPSIKLFATQGRVTVVDAFGELFYSMNTGETWTALDVKSGSGYNVPPPVLMMDANTFYKGGPSGVQSTTDSGKSWHQLNSGLVGTPVQTLIAVNDKLYANSTNGFVFSTDEGESWVPLPGGLDHGVFIEAFNDALYVKRGNQMNSPSPLCCLSAEDHNLTFIDGMPAFERTSSDKTDEEISKIMMEAFTEKTKQNLEQGIPPNPEDIDVEQLNETLNKALQEHASASMMSFIGNFAVSDDTYSVEYGQKLYRWKPGMTEWHNTGLVDKGEDPFASLLSGPFDYSADVSTSYDAIDSMGFKIAVSGSAVYVGKRDGHLFQSFDEGDTWNDVTADISFSFQKFEAIAFAGPTVYVATDKGVTYSSDGTHWHTAIDAEGKTLVVSRLAVEGTTVYGHTDRHVYLLKEGSNIWKQATPEIPGSVISFAVDGNTLYVGTANRGVLRFTIDE